MGLSLKKVDGLYYGSMTKELLEYAQDVAREDAEIAAEILAEDLDLLSQQPSSKCSAKSYPLRLTAKVIRSFLPPSKRRFGTGLNVIYKHVSTKLTLKKGLY